MSDLVIHEKNGFCHAVGAIDDMSNSCIKLLMDSELYQEFSKNSYLRSKEFHVDNILPLYEKVYDNI